jgi:hypothetical protein
MATSFKNFYQGLPIEGRAKFATRAGTTVGYCNKLVYGGAKVELGLADVMVAASGGKLAHGDIPMTERAIKQLMARRDLRPHDWREIWPEWAEKGE